MSKDRASITSPEAKGGDEGLISPDTICNLLDLEVMREYHSGDGSSTYTIDIYPALKAQRDLTTSIVVGEIFQEIEKGYSDKALSLRSFFIEFDREKYRALKSKYVK